MRIRKRTGHLSSLTSQKLHIHNEFHRFSGRRWNNYCGVSLLNKEWWENSHKTKLLEFKQFKNEMTLCHTSQFPACRYSATWTLPGSWDPSICLQNLLLPSSRYPQLSQEEDTEDAAVVGKKNNSGWVCGTWSSRMILARCYLLFHKWKCFPRLNSRNKRSDAYLHRYSKGSRICKWTASPKRQKKYRITYFPSFSPSKIVLPKLDPVAAAVLSTFLLLKEHHINSLLQCQQLTDLLHCLFTWSTKEKQIVILMFVCGALIQSLCKRTARKVVVKSFQLFLTRYFLQPHPSAPTPYSKLGWPGSSSSLIPLAHNKQRQYSVLPGQDLAFINLHGSDNRPYMGRYRPWLIAPQSRQGH